uniref:Uncharacterized protein n=1 Tax=Schistocephalus solidus TaxID=70667 RepID=A0A0X3PNE2_SCHSO
MAFTESWLLNTGPWVWRIVFFFKRIPAVSSMRTGYHSRSLFNVVLHRKKLPPSSNAATIALKVWFLTGTGPVISPVPSPHAFPGMFMLFTMHTEASFASIGTGLIRCPVCLVCSKPL